MAPTGRTLIGLGQSVDYYPFKNFFKFARGITSSITNWPIYLDNDGYPTSDPPAEIEFAIEIPPSYSGRWVLKWTGTGAVFLSPPSPGFTVHSGGGFVSGGTSNTMNVIGADARVEFTPDNAISQINIALGSGAVTYTSMSKLILCRLADEADVDLAEAGDLSKMFNQDYLDAIADLNPRVIRLFNFLGLDVGRGCNISRSKYLPAITAMSYRNRHFHTDAWVGDITGLNTVASGSCPDSATLVDGMAVQGRWVTANTGASTYNYNSTGPKTVVPTTSFAAIPGGYVTANSLVTMIYDSVLDQWMLWPSSSGFEPSLPTEVCAALANAVNKDCWYTMPHLMNDAGVSTIVGGFQSGLTNRLFLEWSNEVWNQGTYAQGGWCETRGAARGVASGDGRQLFSEWGKRHCEVMALATTAWSPRSTTELRRVYAAQAWQTPSVYNTYAFQGGDLGAFGFNSAPNRPIDRTDVLSYAPYTQGAQCQWVDAQYTAAMTTDGPPGYDIGLLGAADLYALGGSSNITAALDWLDWDFRQGTRGGVAGSYTLAAFQTQATAWATVINSYSKELACYEDAWEPLGLTQDRCTALSISTTYGNLISGSTYTSRGKIQTLLDAYKDDARFYTLCLDKLNVIMNSGITTGTTIPAWLFMDDGALPNNPWGMKKGDLYSDSYQSFYAHQYFNSLTEESTGLTTFGRGFSVVHDNGRRHVKMIGY